MRQDVAECARKYQNVSERGKKNKCQKKKTCEKRGRGGDTSQRVKPCHAVSPGAQDKGEGAGGRGGG